MVHVERTPARRLALALCLGAGALAAGCIERMATPVQPHLQASAPLEIQNNAVSQVDLLLEVDNSGSMTQNQENIRVQLATLIRSLTRPEDRDGDGQPDHAVVQDLHVGVISQDLGVPIAGVGGCDVNGGDDGRFSPLARNGDPLRPGCSAADLPPSFLSFDSVPPPGVTADAHLEAFADQFRCAATLGSTGCALEQQLEAVYRALVTHHADDRVGNADPNAGFLRERALLAIVVLSDEEDGSVRPEANAVYDRASTGWNSNNLNSRLYRYDPGSAQDPTYPLDRYINPRDPHAGLLALKPGHPEMIVFAGIVGMPVQTPQRTVDGRSVIDWDALLGAPDPRDRDNFVGRDTGALADDPAGHTSMRPNNPDPACPNGDGQSHPMVPACRRLAPGAVATCDLRPEGYFAMPSRRIIEVARRFDEAPLCNGQPCRNGLVTSICADDYSEAIRLILDRIAARIPNPCLLRELQTRTDNDGRRNVTCTVRETLPVGQGCQAERGRVPATDDAGQAVTVTDAEGVHAVCEVLQVPTNAAGDPLVDVQAQGWFYDTRPAATGSACVRRISFTPDATLPQGASVRFECLTNIGPH